MLRKDLRSMVLSLVLGDGCLHYIKSNGKLFGGLTIYHGLKQADYQSWKAKLLSQILDRNVKVRTGHKGKSVQLSVCMKRFKAWRKFTYPNDKKDILQILKFINNPYFAASVWLMDDGYVNPSFSKLADGTKKNYGARLRLYTCETPVESQSGIIEWYKSNLGVEPKIAIQNNNKTGKAYPYLKFTQKDSLSLWGHIREFILQFKSMQYKFRYIEQIYQYRIIQRRAGDKTSDDIVRHP